MRTPLSLNLTPAGFWWSGSAVVLFACAALIASAEQLDLTLLMVIVATVLGLYALRTIVGHLATLILLFWIAHALYGLSSPISIYFGAELGEVFAKPYRIGEFLLHYALASIGLLLGFMGGAARQAAVPVRRCPPSSASSSTPLWQAALLTALIASTLHVRTLTQLGGLTIFEQGKAFFHLQASEGGIFDLSSFIGVLSAGLVGLALGISPPTSTRRRLPLLFWGLLMAPIMVSSFLMGERGVIVFLLLTGATGYFFYKPLPRLSRRAVVVLTLMYLFLILTFITRGTVGRAILGAADWANLRDIGAETWVRYLNPALIEFGAPFGNFNTYLNNNRTEGALRWGETYTRGLRSITNQLVGGDRYPSITEEFRDAFYSDLSLTGHGVAFSSLLEAYINYGTPGVLCVYGVLGALLALAERKRYGRHSLLFVLVYLAFVPTVLRFHRSNFGLAAWLVPLGVAVFGYALYWLLKHFRPRLLSFYYSNADD